MALLLCVPAARVQAQKHIRPCVDLTYQVDSALLGCPNADEFRAMIAEHLGYAPYCARSTLGVDVFVRSVQTGMEGSIQWTTTDQRLGERHFASQSENCRQMVATMGFVLAVQIQLMATEPTAEGTARSIETQPTVRHESAPNDAPTHIDRADGARASARTEVRPGSAPDSKTWVAGTGAGPSVGFGLGPDPVAQGRLFLTFGLGRAAVEIGAEASWPSTTHLAHGAGFRHALMLGTLAVCGWHGSMGACGLAKLGCLRVHGMGVDEPASPAGFVAQVGPRLAYYIALGARLGLLSHLDASCSLTPWTVDLNHEAGWNLPRFSAVAGIDLTARFR